MRSKPVESPNLDLLRSVAVTYVVAFHLDLYFKKTNLGLWWNIGGWGVLLFFIHTCLVLMQSLERHEGSLRGFRIDWPFYLRRCFRIFPLSMAVVLAVAILRLPVGHLVRGQFYAVHLSHLGLLSNFFLLQDVTHSESIIAPLWSLPLELGMYLVLPAIFLLARNSKNVRVVIGLWTISAIAAWASIHIERSDAYTLLVCTPCFMAGVVAYQLGKTGRKRLPFIGLPVVLALATLLYLRTPKPSRAWIWCLVVGITLPFFSEMSTKWLRTVCHYIARYSYGIYLTHFICIWFAFSDLTRLPMSMRWLIFIVSTVVTPIVLYHTVEAPMISYGHRVVNSLTSMHWQHFQAEPVRVASQGQYAEELTRRSGV